MIDETTTLARKLRRAAASVRKPIPGPRRENSADLPDDRRQEHGAGRIAGRSEERHAESCGRSRTKAPQAR